MPLALDHLSFNCPKAMKEMNREQPNPQVQSSSVRPQKRLLLKSIMLGNEIVSALIVTEGVMFHKHEEKACLMQISGVHPEDELDFSHILDSQVKNDLTRITSSYKPEKTESTYLMRNIILNDDIPVYQPARWLSYA
ncbi:hypothetical protein TNCV_1515881 [Trichonephila clavipes]|nr:hypothetical protein TNCV_1515881 [Trichonephila clavipes]